MFYAWNAKPTLMMPTLAYVVHRPGQGWARANAERVEQEAEAIGETAFWSRFGHWDLPPFPVAFVQLDDRERRQTG